MLGNIRTSCVFAALACASVTIATPAFAQYRNTAANPQWALDGAVGIAPPAGSFGSGLNVGIDLMGAVELWSPRTAPFGFRGEIGYDHFGTSYVNGHASIVRFVVDALYDFHLEGTRAVPYALAGLGLYHVSGVVDYGCATGFLGTCSLSDGSTGVGLNLGGGVRLPIADALQGFLEMRYHLVLTGLGGLSTSPFFPIQVGIRYVLPRS